MKKRFLPVLLILIASLLLAACKSRRVDMNTKVKVVTTIFPIYDWARNLLDEHSNNTLLLSMVIKNQIDYHEFTPTQPDFNQVQNCGLLIYAGGPTDSWIEQALSQTQTKPVTLRLLDLFPEGTDEHIWLNPEFAIICCNAITQAFSQADPDYAQTYQKLNEDYIESLTKLSSKYSFTFDNLSQKQIVLADRNPFQVLSKTYGLTIHSIYETCPHNQNKSYNPEDFSIILDTLNQKTVFTTEYADKKQGKSVLYNSKNPLGDVEILDSMQNVTLAQAFKGKNYINVMYDNLSKIEKVLE